MEWHQRGMGRCVRPGRSADRPSGWTVFSRTSPRCQLPGSKFGSGSPVGRSAGPCQVLAPTSLPGRLGFRCPPPGRCRRGRPVGRVARPELPEAGAMAFPARGSGPAGAPGLPVREGTGRGWAVLAAVPNSAREGLPGPLHLELGYAPRRRNLATAGTLRREEQSRSCSRHRAGRLVPTGSWLGRGPGSGALQGFFSGLGPQLGAWRCLPRPAWVRASPRVCLR